MRTTTAVLVMVLLLCGCVLVLLEGTGRPQVVRANAPKPPDYVLYLNVNAQGEVVLPPLDGRGNQNPRRVLANPTQIEIYLKRLVKEDELYAGAANTDNRVRWLVLRMNGGCAFEKGYQILKAGQSAGFTKFQWRVFNEEEGEAGRIPFVAKQAEEKVTRFTARVKSDEKGKIAKITLRGEGIAKEIDFKGDLDAFAKKLKELVAKHTDKDKPLAMTFEIDGKLLAAEAVRPIDASIRAGFSDVRLMLLDPKDL